MEHGSRTRLVTALLLGAVFGSGVLLGAAADGTLLAEGVEAAASEKAVETKTRRTPMYEQVGPDDQQSARIATIVQEHRARMDALHQEFRDAYDPRYDAIIEESREAIKAVLTPEQAAEYQILIDERDGRRAAERSDSKSEEEQP